MTTLTVDGVAMAANPRELISPALFDRLVRRIVKDDPQIAQPMAERIMAEALAFLQACALNPGARLSPAWAIDIGWHTFILHTREYAEFCQRVAGRFIHHAPTDDADEKIGKYGPIEARGLAPRLLWQAEVDGWLMLGFEHAAGRHPDLSPGSADLAPVAEALAALGRLRPSAVPDRSIAARWARLPAWQQYAQEAPGDLDPWERAHLPRLAELEAASRELFDGDALLHTDLQAGNLLINDGTVMVIDWAWTSRGASWIDPAFMVIRLMAAGHSPQSAESWAWHIPAWRAAPADAVTAFAATVLGLWERKTRSSSARPHSARLTEVARGWAQHRLQAA